MKCCICALIDVFIAGGECRVVYGDFKSVFKVKNEDNLLITLECAMHI